MKNLFASSYIFWVTSRIILIIGGAVEICRIYLEYHTFTGLNILGILYLIGMSIVFFGEITKSKPKKFLKYCTGIVTLLLGFYIAYLKFSQPVSNWGLARYEFDYMKIVAVVFSSWLILLGIFDFFAFNSDSEN